MSEKIANSLKDELIHFANRIEDILDSHNLDSNDVTFIKFFLQKLTPKEAMNHVITNILPWEPQILRRDEDFFYKNKEIFGKLPESKVNYFSNALTHKIGHEDKQEIWDFFEVFITFAQEYKKKL